MNSKIKKNPKKYYIVGSYWSDHEPKDQTDRFVKEGVGKMVMTTNILTL